MQLKRIEIPEGKYLGGICKRGHDWNGTGKSLRYKTSKGCIECNYITGLNYFYNNRKKCNEKTRKYWARNNEKKRARKRELYSQDPERHKRYSIKSYYAKIECIREKRRKWRKLHRKEEREYENKRYKELPDCVVKNMICQKTNLRAKDIPQDHVEWERAKIKTNRLIKERKKMSTKLVTPEGKEVNSAENLIELAEKQMETCNQLEAGIIDDATAESITRTRSGFAKLMKLQLVYNISKARGLTPKMALLENKELESTNKTVQLEEQEVKNE